MPRFIENAKLPITSELIRQGFWPDEADTLTLLDRDDEAHGQDSTIAIASAAIAIISGAGSLALAGLTVAILPSIAGLGWAGIAAYNAKISQRDRQEEAEFLMEHPEILRAIDAKLEAGEERRVVAAAFEQCLKLWRYGDTSQFARFMGQPPSPQLPTTQIESPAPYIPPPQDQDAPIQQFTASLPQGESQQAAKPSYAQTSDDIARSLAEKLQSTLIVGQPGAGKGVLIAMATREVKRLHPDVQIWAIDPKADPQEAGYWQACDRMLSIPISPFTKPEDMEYICDRIDGFIAEFQASHGPKLLIFDEALAVKEKATKWFKALMTGFNALCSMGRSRRQYGWLVSQSPNTDDFGISGGVRNVYRRILLLSQDNLGLLDNGSTYFSGKPTRLLLSQTGRVFFDSTINGWGSVPRYEIPSSPVVPVPNPEPEPTPIGESRRENLERLYRESPSIEPAGNDIDPIERDILSLLQSRHPEGLTAGRIRADKKSLKAVDSSEIEFYLEVLLEEGKIRKDGNIFYYK